METCYSTMLHYIMRYGRRFLVALVCCALFSPVFAEGEGQICRSSDGWYIHPDAPGCLVNDQDGECVACALINVCTDVLIGQCEENNTRTVNTGVWNSDTGVGPPAFACQPPGYDLNTYSWAETGYVALNCGMPTCPANSHVIYSSVTGEPAGCKCNSGYHNVAPIGEQVQCMEGPEPITCPDGYHSELDSSGDHYVCISDGPPCKTGYYNASGDRKNPSCAPCPQPNGLKPDDDYGYTDPISSDGTNLDTCALFYVTAPFWEDDSGYFELDAVCPYKGLD